jgi:hypothetical protein
MVFVNLSLIVGGLLAAVPIVLHLVMRQQPKQFVFPAVRFLQQRRETNRRKLQLRHWLLLALRCAAVLLLAMALARPSVSSATVGNWLLIALLGGAMIGVLGLLLLSLVQRRGRLLVVGLASAASVLLVAIGTLLVATLNNDRASMLGDREAPVSAVLVFDTAPRMLYRFQNRTRLEAAQEIGSWLVSQLPRDSEVAVVDSRPGPAVFAVDLASANKSVERLQVTGIPDRLPSILERALRLVSAGKNARREIYVFTDLAKQSWETELGQSLAARFDSAPDVALYVVDVGVVDPRNLSLGQIRLSAQSVSRNGELEIQTELHSLGKGGVHTVDLFIEEPDIERPVIVDGRPLLPESRRRDRQEISLDENDTQRARFRLKRLESGVHQGYVAVSGGDGLPVDDRRYFAFEVREAWPLLVAAPDGVDATFLTEAVAPYEFRRSERSAYRCTEIRQTELANYVLDPYTVVCLVDPEPLLPSTWQRLGQYVERGGSVAIFLGYHSQPVTAFQVDSARRLIGGKLLRQWRAADRELILAPQRYDHPILVPFRAVATSVPWGQAPIFRHWVLDDLVPEAETLIPYSNGKPALVETRLGQGRVLTLTTPISDPSRPRGRNAWNELPTSEAWPYFVLINELMAYLAGAGDSQLNYLAGETAVLANEPDRDPQRYQLFTPLEEPQEIAARDRQLTVRFTERAGAYRLKGYRGEPVVRGFAVNFATEVTDLTRLSREDLDTQLGAKRYQLARSRDEIVREVGETRVGREFYSYLIAILALVLGVEHLLANRFYRRNESLRDDDRARAAVVPPRSERGAMDVNTGPVSSRLTPS